MMTIGFLFGMMDWYTVVCRKMAEIENGCGIFWCWHWLGVCMMAMKRDE